MSNKFWHILNVLLCVLGIVGGVSGGATFSLMYSNNAASLWATVSVLLFMTCLVQELLHHNDVLHICYTHLTLTCCKVVCAVLALLLAILTALHFVVAYKGDEALENMEYNDYIVGIWTLYCLKSTCGLFYSSHKCHKRLLHLENSRPRPDSPNFLARGTVPYEQLDSPRRASDRFAQRASTSRPFSDDDSVVTETESVSTRGPLAGRVVSIVSDGESALDMDAAAEDLDAGASGFSRSRLVVT